MESRNIIGSGNEHEHELLCTTPEKYIDENHGIIVEILLHKLQYIFSVTLRLSVSCSSNLAIYVSHTLSEKKVLSRTFKGSSAQRSAGTLKGSR